MSLIPWWVKALAILAIVAGIIFGVNMFLDYEQGIGYDRRTAEYTVQENADLKKALEETARLNKVIKEADDAAKIREAQITKLAAANTALLGKLRNTTANIDALVPSATADALRGATRAYGGLFTDCRAAFEGMGRAASGHRSDVKKLSESWITKKE